MEERLATVKQHVALKIEHYGERGLVKLRKHLPWYFPARVGGNKDLRSQLVRINTAAEVDAILDAFLAGPTRAEPITETLTCATV
jgi:tRNA-dihydrouridine synthase